MSLSLAPRLLLASTLLAALPAQAEDLTGMAYTPEGVTSTRSNDDADVTLKGEGRSAVWAAGRTVVVESSSPDLFAGGETIRVTGATGDNFFGAARTFDLSGPIGGDAYLFGAQATVNEDVAGDIYFFGEELHIVDGATVGGNLLFASGRLLLDGRVSGDVQGATGEAILNGSVGGDVHLEAGQLSLGRGAQLEGGLVYSGPKEAVVAEGASVAGAIDYSVAEAHDGQTRRGEPEEEESSFGWSLLWALFRLVAAGLVAVVLSVLLPSLVTRPARIVQEEPQVSFGLGFATLVGVPVLAIFLMLFILPIPLSLLTLAVFFPAVWLARFVTAYVVGQLLLERGGKVGTALGATLLGLLVLHTLYLVPYLGGLVALLASVAGLGAMVLAVRRAQAAA